MSITMYQASVPVFQKMLQNLDGILDKAAASAAARKIEPQVLLTARLAPDMYHFTRQVQIATDHAKGGPARLAGLEPPKYEDNESSFAELKARVARVQAFLATLKPAQIDGSEERKIALKFGPREVRVSSASLPDDVRAAELLLPLRGRVRDPAPQRRGRRQARLRRQLRRSTRLIRIKGGHSTGQRMLDPGRIVALVFLAIAPLAGPAEDDFAARAPADGGRHHRAGSRNRAPRSASRPSMSGSWPSWRRCRATSSSPPTRCAPPTGTGRCRSATGRPSRSPTSSR